MTWLKWLFAAAVFLALLWVALSAYGQWKWSGLTQTLLDGMEATRKAPTPARFDAHELEGLPPVVQRFFRTALPEGAPMVAALAVEHRGTFNMGEAADNWKAFTSQQRVVANAPGFVWDGRVQMFPGVAVHVHDAYVAGEGVLHPAILGVFSLIEMRGHGQGNDMAQGELMRFFAESAWYPTALLPSQGVQWEGLDERSARATLTDGSHRLTLTFTFGNDGLIDTVRAEARGRTENGKVVMRPWQGRFWNYVEREGMRVPLEGEVAWLLPEAQGGRKPYWRGQVTALRYEMAK
jgi:hypothetical protein